VSTSEELTSHEARAWTGLLHAHASLVREVDRELRGAHDLPLPWYDVLSQTASAPGGRIRMGALAERVRMTPAGLSGLVDRLQRADLVERQPCNGDARGMYAVVTRQGRRLLERAHPTYRAAVRQHYTGRIERADLELVGRVWERVAPRSRRP
jgi:DNA-binding MarR family transcriptional regulator